VGSSITRRGAHPALVLAVAVFPVACGPSAAGPIQPAAPPADATAGPAPAVKAFTQEGPAGSGSATFTGPADGAPTDVQLVGPAGGYVPPEFVAAISQTLSVPEVQLRQEWSARPLEEVARAHGADPAALARTLKARWSEQIVRDAAAGRVPSNDVDALRSMQEQLVDGWLKNPLPAESAPGQDEPARPGLPMVERKP
jgi:hypothetical protein